MIDFGVVHLSRAQFALTALYHFLFVPLTLGLSWILVIMESVYVMTGKEIYRDMTKFWGKLFGINFAMGVTTGLTLEFQFGTNWAYYSHYVGDVFGTLAVSVADVRTALANAPEREQAPGLKLAKDLREKHHLLIDGGYGKIKGTTFRISNMGDETEETVAHLLRCLDDCLG